MAVSWGDMYSLSIFAAAVAALMMGLAYAIGRLLDNPKFTVWAKTEIFQVAVSIVMVFMVLFLVGLVGLDPASGFSINAGWIDTYTNDQAEYAHPQIEEDYNIYEVSEAYLQNMAFFSHRAVRASRAMIGIMDEFSKYTRTPCVPPWLMCLMGVNGVNVRPLAGGAVFVQTSNMLLYSSTTAYLTVLAQIFLLKFIQSGLIVVYLPMAIVLRSLPFMRQLGGAILAICLALFIIFPFLLFVESAFWNPYVWVEEGDVWSNMDSFVSGVESKEGAAAYGDLFFGGVSGAEWGFEGGDYGVANTVSYNKYLIILNSAAFLSSVFMFTFNMIAVTASASLFARLMGSEVDLSRLMQIV
jgi:hypothetical protein